MNGSDKRLLVVQVAALGADLIETAGRSTWQGGRFRNMQTCFPALTCPAQAAFRTGAPAATHGMVANGRYFRELDRVMFWEQSKSLVEGPRIWDRFRAAGGTVGVLFWQQSLGEAADLLISPQPIHKHSGGMIQGCNSKPRHAYERVKKSVGRGFQLAHYWGPLASRKSSDWVADATAAVLRDEELRTDLCLSYLPVLDYDLQRHGPDSRQAGPAMDALFEELDRLHSACQETGYELLIFGDYAISQVSGRAIYPNRHLRKAGLLSCRDVRGMAYPDLCDSRAFAMVDHEVAHIYIDDAADIDDARRAVSEIPGVECCDRREVFAAQGIDHPNAGELIAVAEPGSWFAYPWWTDDREAPDYATHIDIHNKPGYDPCELFFGWPPLSVSRDTSKVRGSHGRNDGQRDVCYWSSIDLPVAQDLPELGRRVGDWLNT